MFSLYPKSTNQVILLLLGILLIAFIVKIYSSSEIRISTRIYNIMKSMILLPKRWLERTKKKFYE
jgi:hypothetical protein